MVNKPNRNAKGGLIKLTVRQKMPRRVRLRNGKKRQKQKKQKRLTIVGRKRVGLGNGGLMRISEARPVTLLVRAKGPSDRRLGNGQPKSADVSGKLNFVIIVGR